MQMFVMAVDVVVVVVVFVLDGKWINIELNSPNAHLGTLVISVVATTTNITDNNNNNKHH